jgi:hypothetical protein
VKGRRHVARSQASEDGSGCSNGLCQYDGGNNGIMIDGVVGY